MPLFEFTLNINPEHMPCAICSTAIRGTLEILFKENFLTCEIATDFRNKKVEFSLDLPDREKAEWLVKQCRDRLLPMYETLSDSIETLDQKSIETKPLKPDYVPEKHSLWSAFPLIGLGVLLMLSEYFEYLPDNSTLTGTLVNAGIGAGSTVLTGWFGKQHFKNAWRARSSSSSGAMDSLIVLGSTSAILYSFVKIFFPSFAGKDAMPFFEVPLITIGTVEASHWIRDRVHANIATEVDAIGESKNSLPKTVSVYLEDEKKISERSDHKIDESKLEKFFVSRVQKDSIIRIPPLAIVPIDGQVIESKQFSIHESYFGRKGLTAKQFNSKVFAGSINKSDYSLLLKTCCEPENNQIRKAYRSVQTTAAPANISLDTVSKYFFRGVLGIATVSGGAWWIFGPPPGLSNASQVFFSDILGACPCGIGLINVGESITKALAIDSGILIQKDRALTIDQATHICIDKCGTLTTGDYSFHDIATLDNKTPGVPAEGNSPYPMGVEGGESFAPPPSFRAIGSADAQDINRKPLPLYSAGMADKTHQEELKKWLHYAVVLQNQIDKKFQSAPGKAIINSQNDIRWKVEFKEPLICSTFQDNPVNKGRGGFAVINGHEVVLGNKSLLRHHAIPVDSKWEDLANLHNSRGLLPIFFAFDRQLKCLLILESKLETEQILRPDCLPAIQWLLQHNKSVHILTGDSLERTQVLMHEFGDIGINVLAEQTPQDKINFIKNLQQDQKIVVMIGDDENDLDSIRQANFGVSIDSLAKVSREADVILNGSLKGLIQVIRLTKNNRLCYNISLIGAFGFNSLGILTACGVLYPLTKKLLHPMIPIAVMSTSSLCLIINIAVFKYLGIRAIKIIDREFSRAEQHSLHCHPANFLKMTAVLIMIVSYMALFYNAAAVEDGLDPSDLLKGKINWLYLTLTLLIGMSQGIKIHGMGHADAPRQSRSEMTEVLLPSESFSVNYKKTSRSHLSKGKIAICSIMLLAPGGFGCYALWNQAQSFAQRNLAVSISLFIPNLIRLILLPGRDMKILFTHSLFKTGSLIILFSACGFADSHLLANQVNSQSPFYWLSALGLCGSMACYDVAHSVNIKAAYQKFKELACTRKYIALVLAGLAGVLHASQPVLGLFHLVKLRQPLAILGAQTVATAVKGITGAMNALRYVNMWNTRSFSVPDIMKNQENQRLLGFFE